MYLRLNIGVITDIATLVMTRPTISNSLKKFVDILSRLCNTMNQKQGMGYTSKKDSVEF